MLCAVVLCAFICGLCRVSNESSKCSGNTCRQHEMQCIVLWCFVLSCRVMFCRMLGNSCCLQMLPVCFVGIHSVRDTRNLRCFVVLCYTLYCYVRRCDLLLCDILCFVAYATYRMDTFCFLCYVLPFSISSQSASIAVRSTQSLFCLAGLRFL